MGFVFGSGSDPIFEQLRLGGGKPLTFWRHFLRRVGALDSL
jgi:hypothetical protein